MRSFVVMSMVFAGLFFPASAQVSKPIEWMCIGNSITQGVFPNVAYAPKLAKRLGPRYTVENDGVHPSTAGQDMLAHILYRNLTATSAQFFSVPRNLSAMTGQGDALRIDRWRGITVRNIGPGNRLVTLTDLRGTIIFQQELSGNAQVFFFKPKSTGIYVVGIKGAAGIFEKKNMFLP